MQALKQSTVTTILVGPVLDASGLAVTSAVLGDFNITKNGTSATLTGATVTHSHNGHYTIALTTGNTDTLGRLTISVNNAAMAMAPYRYTVLAAAAFDTLVTNGTLASTTSGRTIAVDASGIVTDTTGTTTLLSRLTSTRAGNLDLLDVAISTLQSQITALNNLSAKCNWFGNTLLEIPDSGSRAYLFELVVKDDEDKLVNLDSLPTITLTNAAGTDRSSLITTGIASVATGRYTLTITVGTSTTNEALTLRATGTVSGETRYAVLTTQVVDYDSATLINSIYTRLGAPAGASIAADISGVKAKTDLIPSDIGSVLIAANSNREVMVTGSHHVAADVHAFQTDVIDNDAVAASAVTKIQNGLATSTAQTAAKTILDKLDSGLVQDGLVWQFTANMLELAPSGGGGGGGDATLANQTTIINHLTDIKGTGWSSATDTLEKIRDSITNALASLIATVGITPGSITGFPASLSIGDSYTEDCDRAIHLFVRDDSDDPIAAVGDHLFTDTDFEAVVIITQSGRTGRVTGSATWVDASPSEGYLKIELPSSETRRAAIGAATVQILLKWTGAQYTLPSVSTSWVAQI